MGNVASFASEFRDSGYAEDVARLLADADAAAPDAKDVRHRASWLGQRLSGTHRERLFALVNQAIGPTKTATDSG